ncbi:hypothetical protein BG011_007508 [Mortierella polycephala]|uniref:RBR-type E3 ubiquitin transferase n=1 Tax=Mortierella polycephala TaxID=41804 RepID=A0A9P6PT82_9FUNG|nr:hypothetical protein BG011_007508 [Mortierella polycephala]
MYSSMALHESDDFDDDYVILSDIESDLPEYPSSILSRTNNISLTAAAKLSVTSPQHQHQHQQQQSGPEDEDDDDDDDEDDDRDVDEDDIEEIEYGYDNDTLIVMPGMLRNYSHHATNYHPELWQSPIPGRYSPQPSKARCRQEDRMLDRQELLKNSIPPTTCGICFESFTTFDLQNLYPHHQEDKAKDLSPRAQFARSFTERLARSFALKSPNTSSNNDNSDHQHDGDFIPDAPALSSSSSSSFAHNNTQRASVTPTTTTSASSITPSVSSRDIGIVMSCDHGLCLSCLQSFLTNATQTPQARFPTLCPQPGCRTPIPTESAELVLDPETLEIWYRKLAEIHVANKVCCPRPECRSIIDLDDRDGTAVTCPECLTSFCASCAVPFHRGMTCEQYQTLSLGGESEEDRAMLQLVQDRRWRHCPSCRFVIEKQHGCNHMVCHCGQSFCYKCGQPWNEMDARCSLNCESEGVHEDLGLDCNIM